MNGVFLNSSRNRLSRGQPHPLSSGDRLLIEPYEIRISIETDESAWSGRVESTGDSDPFGLAAHAVDDPFGPPHSPQPVRGGSFEPPMLNRQPQLPSALDAPDQVSREDLDPLALLDLKDDRPARKGPPPPSARDPAHGALLDQHFRPPDVVPDERPASPAPIADPHAIPLDYDPLADQLVAEPPARPLPPPLAPPRQAPAPPIVERSSPPRISDFDPPPRPRFEPNLQPSSDVAQVPPVEGAQRTPEPVPPSRPVSVAPSAPPPPAQASTPPPAPPAGMEGTLLAEFLTGAGLKPADLTPELARTFGQIIRVVVSGVIDVLASRREIKDEFRIQVTRVQMGRNNPLKQSANVEDALHRLLVQRNPAYLGPVEAFEDAFTDLRNHQVAMLVGMRAAFESMLAEFKPDRLQEDFDQRASRGLLAKLGSSYWDLFRDKWQQMDRDRDATFRRLFRDEFARAYEEQLQQLKKEAAARASKPKPPTGD